MEHWKRKWHKYFMYSWKRNRKYFVSKLCKLERKFFHTYKMHFYLLITTWYILTFELSVPFVRHAFHLWFLLIFYDDVYRWHIPPPCLVSRQIILKDNLPAAQTWQQNLPLVHVIIKYQEVSQMKCVSHNSSDNLNVKAYQVLIKR